MHLRDVASGALMASSAMGAALTSTIAGNPASVAATATAGGTHDSSAVLQSMIEAGELNFREGPLGPFRHRCGEIEDPHNESHVLRSRHACRKFVRTSDGVDPCEHICHRSISTSSTMPAKPFAGIHPPGFDDRQSSVTHPITRLGVNGTEGCLVVAVTDAGLFQAMAAASTMTMTAKGERDNDDSPPIKVTTNSPFEKRLTLSPFSMAFSQFMTICGPFNTVVASTDSELERHDGQAKEKRETVTVTRTSMGTPSACVTVSRHKTIVKPTIVISIMPIVIEYSSTCSPYDLKCIKIARGTTLTSTSMMTTTFTRLKCDAQEKTVTVEPAPQTMLDMTQPAEQRDYSTYCGPLISTSTFHKKKKKKTHSKTKTSTMELAQMTLLSPAPAPVSPAHQPGGGASDFLGALEDDIAREASESTTAVATPTPIIVNMPPQQPPATKTVHVHDTEDNEEQVEEEEGGEEIEGQDQE